MDWKQKIEKNLGKNALNYLFHGVKLDGNTFIFPDQESYDRAMMKKSDILSIFPDAYMRPANAWDVI